MRQRLVIGIVLGASLTMGFVPVQTPAPAPTANRVRMTGTVVDDDGVPAPAMVPDGPSPVVLNLKVRSPHNIVAGESLVVTVEPTSPLCVDGEDITGVDHRCETVFVESDAGTLTVEGRATSDGSAATMFCCTSFTYANYAGRITRPAPGTVVIPVKRGWYPVLIGVPVGAPAKQFKVTTSLRQHPRTER